MEPGRLLELDWEVGVFRALRALWRWAVPEAATFDPTRGAALDDLLPRLVPLAQLVAGEPVRVLAARTEGGVRGRDLLVPGTLQLLPDPEANVGLYTLRVVHAAAVRRVTRGKPVPTDPVDQLRATFDAVVAARDLLAGELPRFAEAWDEGCTAVLATRPPPGSLPQRAGWLELARQAVLRGSAADAEIWEKLRTTRWTPTDDDRPVALWGRLIPADTDGDTQSDCTDGAAPDGTEAQAPPVEELRRVLLDPKAQEEHVVYHTFEKVETADSFDGNSKSADGADEMDDHLEALDEVDLRELIRDGEQAHSVYKADLDLGADVPDVERIAPGERGVPYDEWDHRARAYKKAWCTVYPSAVTASRPAWVDGALARHRPLVERLRRRLEVHRSERRPKDRQLDGEEPDLDALVDRYAEVRAGRSGSPRVYVRNERQRRSFATTVLLDVSLSTDGWVDDRRVLDVSRDAVLVLGEVADALGDELEILAFASSTRNRCRVWQVKGFRDPWIAARGRLGALEPQGYTRIGPALRHATRGLLRSPADQLLLLLVSDGKPNDYDRYEGNYGIADVRMALREAEAARIVAHALAVDAGARAWLPAMFGPGRWHVLPTPDHLLPALTEVYGRLTG